MEEEGEENYQRLEEKLLTFLKEKMNVECTSEGIDYVSRLGRKPGTFSPVLVRFVQLKKKLEILKNRNYLKGMKYNIDEDYSPEIREKRKSLLPDLIKLRAEGKRAVLRQDKLVILPGSSSQQLTNQQYNSENDDKAMECDEVEQEAKRKRYKTFHFTPSRLMSPGKGKNKNDAGPSTGTGNIQIENLPEMLNVHGATPPVQANKMSNNIETDGATITHTQ